MERILFLLMAVTPIALPAQDAIKWESTEVIDEWGDPSGTYSNSYWAEGIYNCTGRVDRFCWGHVTQIEDDVIIELYEEQGNPLMATLSKQPCTGKIKVKRADGKVEQYTAYIKGRRFWNGEIELGEAPILLGKDFASLLKNGNGEIITVLIKSVDFSDYSGNWSCAPTTYRFQVQTQLVKD